MKPSLQPGVVSSTNVNFDRGRAIDFLGEKARGYGAPVLVRDIETARRGPLLTNLETDEGAVGTRVEVDHTAATLMRMPVTIEVKMVEVEGRAVTFEITGRDSVEAVRRGRHNRFVVDVKTTEARLAAKAQKAGIA